MLLVLKNKIMELGEILFGKYCYQEYIGSVIITFIGYAIWFLINYLMSKKPSKWDWQIFHADKNVQYLILLFIASWVFLRFNADALAGIKKATGSQLGFIEDFWFWFLLGGMSFRIIIHRLHKLYKKHILKQ